MLCSLQEFLDPITFSCIQDPVLLCGTGQIYDLRSLRAWLATGSRTCPKTNMAMRDVEASADGVGRAGPGRVGRTGREVMQHSRQAELPGQNQPATAAMP